MADIKLGIRWGYSWQGLKVVQLFISGELPNKEGIFLIDLNPGCVLSEYEMV